MEPTTDERPDVIGGWVVGIPWGRVMRLSGGLVLVVLGIAGLALPVLQGILFLVIGVALLAPDVPPARRLLVNLLRRYPRVRRRLPRWLRRMSKRNGDA